MNGIVKSIQFEAQANTFVDSCTAKGFYSGEQCQCLVGVFDSTYPNIRRSGFSRRTMREIIYGNPFLGIAVGFSCRVYNY
jgi:hypothetical protein